MRLIYKATNRLNGKVYVGQTKSTLPKRKSEHKSAARKSDYAFHRALRKYGFENFDWEVLTEVGDLEVNQREQELIKLHGAFGPNGYNTTEGGDAKYEVSLTVRRKIARATKRRFRDPKERERVSVQRIEFLSDINNRDVLRKASKRLHQDREFRAKHLAGVNRKLSKPVQCVETGVVFPSLRTAAKTMGLSQGNISAVLAGTYKHTGGFRFKLASLKEVAVY
jgi:group I intron endonuclease